MWIPAKKSIILKTLFPAKKPKERKLPPISVITAASLSDTKILKCRTGFAQQCNIKCTPFICVFKFKLLLLPLRSNFGWPCNSIVRYFELSLGSVWNCPCFCLCVCVWCLCICVSVCFYLFVFFVEVSGGHAAQQCWMSWDWGADVWESVVFCVSVCLCVFVFVCLCFLVFVQQCGVLVGELRLGSVGVWESLKIPENFFSLGPWALLLSLPSLFLSHFLIDCFKFLFQAAGHLNIVFRGSMSLFSMFYCVHACTGVCCRVQTCATTCLVLVCVLVWATM